MRRGDSGVSRPLAEAVGRKRSQLVVGLDPRLDVLPMELRARQCSVEPLRRVRWRASARELSTRSIPTSSRSSPRRHSSRPSARTGSRAEEVCAYARSIGLLVILDAKRGDVASTSRAYVAAYLEPNEERIPLGRRDHRGPLSRPRCGGALPRRVQAARFGSLLPRTHLECGRGGRAGRNALGRPAAVAAPRRPSSTSGAQPLVGEGRPVGRRGRRRRDSSARGLGGPAAHAADTDAPSRRRAQGATPADVARAFTSGPASALVTASRSVIFAFRDTEEDWRVAAAGAAERLSTQVWAASGW